MKKPERKKPKVKSILIDTGEEVFHVPLPERPFEDSYGILKGVSTKDLIEMRKQEREREY